MPISLLLASDSKHIVACVQGRSVTQWVWGGTKNIIYSTRGVNRAGPNAGRAGPGRAEQFYNLLGIRAGFLQSFTRTNFLTN